MNRREITISSINGLRNIMAQNLITVLNNHWNDAAFGRSELNMNMVLSITKTIKECGQRILSICKTQSNYIPWTEVRTKKRSHNDEDHTSTKSRKIGEEKLKAFHVNE